LIVTSPRSARAASPAEITSKIGEFSGDVRVYSSVDAALDEELGRTSPGEDDVFLITGSFFVVGEARQWLKKHE